MRAYVSQLICHFGRIWRICIGLFVPRDFWDYLCPRAWDHLCPAFMELRVNLRCQIVCVYLTCFLNLVFSFDLKSAYHHIDICEEHRKFLSFSGLLLMEV